MQSCARRYTEDRDCQVLWSVGLQSESDLTSLLSRVSEAGIPTQDISSLEEAQVGLEQSEEPLHHFQSTQG